MGAMRLEYGNCLLRPGYVAVSEDPCLLRTVCGSGIVLTLWDRLKKVGGMIHCVLPGTIAGERRDNFHADMAVYSLVKEMIGVCDSSSYWEAQLFGGASRKRTPENKAVEVIGEIKGLLQRLKITIVCEDTGGRVGRKIIFDTYSGDIISCKTSRIRNTDWEPAVK